MIERTIKVVDKTEQTTKTSNAHDAAVAYIDASYEAYLVADAYAARRSMSHEEKRTPPKKPLVLVEWEDASNNPNYWNETEKIKPLFKCHTVGFVMHRNRKRIVLASEGFDDGEYRHLHTIPKKMVVKIHLLKRE